MHRVRVGVHAHRAFLNFDFNDYYFIDSNNVLLIPFAHTVAILETQAYGVSGMHEPTDSFACHELQ